MRKAFSSSPVYEKLKDNLTCMASAPLKACLQFGAGFISSVISRKIAGAPAYILFHVELRTKNDDERRVYPHAAFPWLITCNHISISEFKASICVLTRAGLLITVNVQNL